MVKEGLLVADVLRKCTAIAGDAAGASEPRNVCFWHLGMPTHRLYRQALSFSLGPCEAVLH